mgnify:CR=1 FL=1
MNSKDCIGLDDRWMMLIGIPLMGFVFPLVFFGQKLGHGLADYLPVWGFSAIFTGLTWGICRLIWMFIHDRIPDNEPRRLLVTIPILLVVPPVFCRFLDILIKNLPIHRPFEPSLFQSLTSGIFGIIMVVGIYEAIHFFNRFRTSELENERLRRTTTQAQLDGLRQQVNPHFLFNSLNTLATLIPEDPQKAVFFVEKLAKVYRYLLDLGDRSLVEFREEIAFTENYVYLLKERFGENFSVKINVPEEERGQKLPPLTLQILVENAVKHNVISSAKPLKIDVFAEKSGRIVVKNNLQPKNRLPDSPGMGLENIHARYAFFTEKKVDVLETQDEFVVLFPLIAGPEIGFRGAGIPENKTM